MKILFSELLITTNSVGIVTGYGLDGLVSIPGKGKKFISSLQVPDRLWGQPPIQ
jgi:hypothetical protein